jgi:hypothetical protein
MEIGKPGRASDVIDVRGQSPQQAQATIAAHDQRYGTARATPPSGGSLADLGPGSAPGPVPSTPATPSAPTTAPIGPQAGPIQPTVGRRNYTPGQSFLEQETGRPSVAEQMGQGFQLGNANLNENGGAAFRIRPLSTPRMGEVTQGTMGI